MKIGILTYHRTHNYGGCLQALAMRLILENLGHTVYYIDYWPDYHKQAYSIFSLNLISSAPTFFSGVRSCLESLRYLPYAIKRRKKFVNFLNDCIIPFCRPLTEQYDIIVYGSDQIWRKQPSSNDYNPVYFGQNDFDAEKNVAFSASMGVLPKTDVDRIRVKELCSNFSKIAVREKDLCQLLHEMGYTNTIVTMDPTLLIPHRIWDKFLKKQLYEGPKYVLFYELNKGTFDISKVYKYAKERGLILKTISGRATKNDTITEITTAGPYEFMYWIKNAEYVFSSSFHGLAFSIIYEKQVFVSFQTNAERAKSLLDAAGMSQRFIEPNADIPAIAPIDYEQVRKKLAKNKEISLNYLATI